MNLLLPLMLVLLWPGGGMAAGGDNVLLKDIEVLTLYHGKMTNGKEH